MTCRKNVNALTAQEKLDFITAVKAMKANGKYNQYVKTHMDAMNHATPASGSPLTRNAAHRGPAFLPWHREFLRRFEQDLQAEVPGAILPYWDWASDAALADPATATVWGTDLMGGNGDAADGDLVKTGPFAFDPADPNAWTLSDDTGADTGAGLQRAFGVSAATLPTQAQVDTVQALTPYDASPWTTGSGGYRNSNEGWASVGGSAAPNMHNRVHVWVGGSMLPGTSPNDPVFFLHHCFVDKLWADWQAAHPGEAFVPGPTESADLDGHRLNDAMFPWSTTVADVLDHRGLGYVYDSDAPEVTLQTTSLVFNDVPEGQTTVRAVVFALSACQSLTFNISDGPTVLSGAPGVFGTPLGTSVTVSPHDTDTARVWISYTGTTALDTATGTVTVTCVETGQDFVVPISANTIAKPTVASVLVLDQSNSMNFDAGDGRARIDVLKDAAPVFVDLLGDDDAVGVVRFDDDAHPGTPIAVAGPLPFGAGRTAAKAAISSHTPNPAGNTSIGDGIAMAHADLGVPALTGFDRRAIVVLTDGQENRAQYIADIAALIDDQVYAIGLGSADQINPVALTALTNGTGGYVLMTGALSTDDFFVLQKYYLQILAGVTNADIVLDPDGWLASGQKLRIPFRLSETDITADAILLTGSAPPDLFRFALETPDGALVTPATAAALPDITYAAGARSLLYRMTLPLPVSGHEEREGLWHALLQLDDKVFRKYLASLDNDRKALAAARTHGVRYSLNVHASSNLSLRARLLQDSNQPGARLTVRATLTEYGLPVENRAAVALHLARPDGSTALIDIAEIEPGIYQASSTAAQPGIYRFRVLATGRTLRGRPFTREQWLTGAVWAGGDRPPPSSDGGTGTPEGHQHRLCRLLRCLLSIDSVRAKLKSMEIDVDAVSRCVEACSKDEAAAGAVAANPELVATLKQALADPAILREALRGVTLA